jgi:aldehyde dehydrogenase (NAD+)
VASLGRGSSAETGIPRNAGIRSAEIDIGDDAAVNALGALRVTNEHVPPVSWRREQLRQLERMIDAEESELAAAVQADLGKSRFDCFLSELATTKAESVYARKHLARWARPFRIRLPIMHRPGRAWVESTPVGTIAIIGPWNYPVYLTLGPLVGVLAAGNTAIIKPSEYAPATSAALAELIPKYLDPQAVRVLEGGAEQTRALIRQPLGHIFFTGGTAVGADIMRQASTRLTPVTLELGGKSPVVIAADANIEIAARRTAFAKVLGSGQTCVAPDYAIVENAVAQRFIELVSGYMRQFVGAAGDDHVRIVNQSHTARLLGLIDSAGGQVVVGGCGDVSRCRVQPTVIVNPEEDSALMKEEIFGPILPVLTVGSFEDAVELVRKRPDPLAAYVFSESSTVQDRFVGSVRTGAVVINQLMMHVGIPALPFGGVGTSGMGAYHGKTGFDTFSHKTTVLKKPTWPDPALLYPPYGRLKQRLIRRVL